MQHYWATAVETADMFTGQALKSNVGSDNWKRFFSLAGSRLAMFEACPLVPGAPSKQSDLVNELKALSTELKVVSVLEGFSHATHASQSAKHGARWFLLVSDSSTGKFHAQGFTMSEQEEATNEYLRLEQENLGNPSVQIALVSVNSIQDLRSAYPNYYFDSLRFVALSFGASSAFWKRGEKK